jgi:hypothetical protein
MENHERFHQSQSRQRGIKAESHKVERKVCVILNNRDPTWFVRVGEVALQGRVAGQELRPHRSLCSIWRHSDQARMG